MQSLQRVDNEKQELERLSMRLQELNNTSSQILIFLSFAIVAAVTFLTAANDPARKNAISSALHWWIGAIFPTLIGIIPLKLVHDRSLSWHLFLLWMRFVLLCSAIGCIFVGAIKFFSAI